MNKNGGVLATGALYVSTQHRTVGKFCMQGLHLEDALSARFILRWIAADAKSQAQPIQSCRRVTSLCVAAPLLGVM